MQSNEAESPPQVSLHEAFLTWSRVAALSFGGPAGQIAVMHRIIVDEKKWISEERFLHALNYCMLLPGPEAQQLATYIGWLMHRTIGGIMAGTLFILPGIVAILGLSILYVNYQQTDVLTAIFFGLKPAVLAIVLEAVQRIGKRVLKNKTMVALAAAAFGAIFLFAIPFPVVILTAALVGLVRHRMSPTQDAGSRNSDNVATSLSLPASSSLWRRSVVVSLIFLTLWFGPLIVLALVVSDAPVFLQEALFFSKAAVMTFGGAYSVLSYLAQQSVERYGWLTPTEMLDGLGMAETTPGPLIMVVQFVGFLAAFRNPGPLSPMAAGILGSMITTWVTFVPCFFWIFLGAPFVERLRGNRWLNAALSSITAAVVGVILNLAVWFSINTLFGTVQTIHWQGLRLLLPDWRTVNVTSCCLAVLACTLTFYLKRGMALTLAVCAAVGAVAYWLGWA